VQKKGTITYKNTGVQKMTPEKFAALLSAQTGIKDVSEADTVKDEETGTSRTQGFLSIGVLKGIYIYITSPVFNTVSIGVNFQYTLLKKDTKERALNVINDFNKTKTGLKATFRKLDKGKLLDVSLRSELIVPLEDSNLERYIGLLLPIISASPMIFSQDLSSKGLNHESIVRK
jgi:hypothetical protein